MKIFFVGNSHTYYNELPRMVRDFFASVGRRVDVNMTTKGGEGVIYHSEQRDVLFNICYGGYDVIVFQDKATNFNPDDFMKGMGTIAEQSLSQTNARRILYMPWANRDKPEEQAPMTAAYQAAAAKHNCTLAPVGEIWHPLLAAHPELELYRPDGNHATPLGTYLAAAVIFYTISGSSRALNPADDDALITRLGLDPNTCRLIHQAVAAGLKKFR